jgi:hypothetical protein
MRLGFALVLALCACGPQGSQSQDDSMASKPQVNVLNASVDKAACKNPLAASPDAAKREPVEYIVQFNDPQTHYVDIAAHLPTEGRDVVEVMLPVWTPGSYMLREYSRNIEAVSASTDDGAPLPLVKSAKNRWQVTAGKASSVLIRYRVYGREMTVRNNWIERDFALLNGAATFMTLVDGQERPHDVRVVPHKGWRQTVTGLPIHPDGSSLHFRAPNFDVLVDSPILSGSVRVQEFEVSGKRHVRHHRRRRCLGCRPRGRRREAHRHDRARILGRRAISAVHVHQRLERRRRRSRAR